MLRGVGNHDCPQQNTVQAQEEELSQEFQDIIRRADELVRRQYGVVRQQNRVVRPQKERDVNGRVVSLNLNVAALPEIASRNEEPCCSCFPWLKG